MKILLPIDGSAHTKRMLAYIAAHDELLGPSHEYTLFTAVLPIPAHAAAYIDSAALNGYYDEQAQLVLRATDAFARQQGWRVKVAHEAAHAAPAIAAFAEAGQFDLIVMGTHGHSALGNVLLGSVATGVLARARVPVLLVP